MVSAVCESFHILTLPVAHIPAGFYVLARIFALITLPIGNLGISPVSKLHHSLGQRLHRLLPRIESGIYTYCCADQSSLQCGAAMVVTRSVSCIQNCTCRVRASLFYTSEASYLRVATMMFLSFRLWDIGDMYKNAEPI